MFASVIPIPAAASARFWRLRLSAADWEMIAGRLKEDSAGMIFGDPIWYAAAPDMARTEFRRALHHAKYFRENLFPTECF